MQVSSNQAHDEAEMPALLRHWWVNHKQTYPREIEGEYLWWPRKNQKGVNREASNNMTRVMPGDVVFSFADDALRAVGVALGRAREAPPPTEGGRAGEEGGMDPGWQVPVRFIELEHPLRPRDHRAQLGPVLPAKNSPIGASGDGSQGAYLAVVPDALAAKLRELLGGQAENIVEKITQALGGRLADDAEEEAIQQRTDIGPSMKVNLLSARRGQGVYRESVELTEKSCRVTGLLDRRHLIASHIKPWCKSNDAEKLDGSNGLLLSPHLDQLFARGYLSFSDSGDLLVSRYLNPAVLTGWGIALPRNVGAFRPEQCWYLEYHRREVFERHGGGRRQGQGSDPDTVGARVGGEPVITQSE